jgi:hypothetical protein
LPLTGSQPELLITGSAKTKSKLSEQVSQTTWNSSEAFIPDAAEERMSRTNEAVAKTSAKRWADYSDSAASSTEDHEEGPLDDYDDVSDCDPTQLVDRDLQDLLERCKETSRVADETNRVAAACLAINGCGPARS